MPYINDFDELLEKAVKLQFKEEEDIVEKLIEEASLTKASIYKDQVKRYMEKLVPVLLKERIKNSTEIVWKKHSGIVRSFGEFLKKVRVESGIGTKETAAAAEMSEEDMQKFERSNEPIIETKNISELVSILDIFGITIKRLVEIISCENKFLVPSLQTSKVNEWIAGVEKSRYIDEPQYIMPSLADFISSLKEEIKKRKLDELLF